MLEMCDRITKLGQLDLRLNTLAAICFWKFCEHSVTYQNIYVNLGDFCKNHEKMLEEKIRRGQILKCFDVTPENVRKVYKESIADKFYAVYLPDWNGRVIENYSSFSHKSSKSTMINLS